MKTSHDGVSKTRGHLGIARDPQLEMIGSKRCRVVCGVTADENCNRHTSFDVGDTLADS